MVSSKTDIFHTQKMGKFKRGIYGHGSLKKKKRKQKIMEKEKWFRHVFSGKKNNNSMAMKVLKKKKNRKTKNNERGKMVKICFQLLKK